MSVETISGNSLTSSMINDNAPTNELSSEDFLVLMLKELQYQDPLSPQSAENMMEQMAQLSTVDQLGDVNSNLNTLQMYEAAVNNTLAINLVGKGVEVKMDDFEYSGDGGADFIYYGTEAFESVTVTVKESDGTVVATYDITDFELGRNEFEWNGLDSDGQPVEAGNYEVSIFGNPKNDEGLEESELVPYTLNVYMKEVVDSVLFQDGSIIVRVGDQEIPIENISEVFNVNG